MSRSNLTKYCACHAERLTYLIIITYHRSAHSRGQKSRGKRRGGHANIALSCIKLTLRERIGFEMYEGCTEVSLITVECCTEVSLRCTDVIEVVLSFFIFE